MEITDNDNDNIRNEGDIFGEGYEEFLFNQNKQNSATAKKEDQNKAKKYDIFEDSDEDEDNMHPKSELNIENKKTKVELKQENPNPNPNQKFFIKKKTSRPVEEEKKEKKKNSEFGFPKTKTEIDYKDIKKKNKQNFDNIYNYYNDEDHYINMYNEEKNPEELLNMFDELDDINSNKKKQSPGTQINNDKPEDLDMIISSLGNK